MTTTQAKFLYLAPADMTDDNMEISSEFGGGGDEDLDIDLDIPTDHHDEDHALEDAKVETEFDEMFEVPYENNQAGGKDDLMVDGENPSFAMNDFDAHDIEINDLDPDDANDSEMAPLTQEDEQLNKLGGASSAGYIIEAAETSETNWANGHNPNSSAENEHAEGAISEVLVSKESSESLERQEVFRSPPNATLNPKSPSETADPGPSSGTAEPVSKAILETANEAFPAVGALPSAHVDGKEALDGSEDHVLENHDCIVIYQDTEYALIAKSEDDNPDSFFLKDNSLTLAPLSTFFIALREVLGDDVASDEELCLSIEDLSLEFTETCLAIDRITFKQVIDLRAKLFSNDGVQPSGPAFITLTVKPEFSRKFAVLSAGAAEGKGLSELVSWDEVSRDVDEEDKTRGEGENRALTGEDEDENAGENRVINDSLATSQEEILSKENLVNEDSAQQGDIQHVQEISGNFGEVSHQPAASANVRDASRNFREAARGDNTSGKRDQSVSNQSQEEVDEDGDLIDYEEEEFEQGQRQTNGSNSQNGSSTHFISSCIKSCQSCFCLDCTENMCREYETANENLRRRAISESHEHMNTFVPEMQNQRLSFLETKLTNLVTSENASQYLEATDGNDEEAEEYDEPADEQGENLEQTDSLDRGNDEDDFSGLVNENFEQLEANADEDNFDEIGYDTKDKSEGLPVDEIGYDEALEAADSNESDHTLVEDDKLEALDEAGDELDYDEINYDDDDHQPEGSENHAKVAEVTSVQSGKRPRDDIEEFLDTDGKGSKRARS